jgi:hypothetical protein
MLVTTGEQNSGFAQPEQSACHPTAVVFALAGAN